LPGETIFKISEFPGVFCTPFSVARHGFCLRIVDADRRAAQSLCSWRAQIVQISVNQFNSSCLSGLHHAFSLWHTLCNTFTDIVHLFLVKRESSALDKGVLPMLRACGWTPFFIPLSGYNRPQFHLWLNKLTFLPFNPRFSRVGFWHSMLRIPAR